MGNTVGYAVLLWSTDCWRRYCGMGGPNAVAPGPGPELRDDTLGANGLAVDLTSSRSGLNPDSVRRACEADYDETRHVSST